MSNDTTQHGAGPTLAGADGSRTDAVIAEWVTLAVACASLFFPAVMLIEYSAPQALPDIAVVRVAGRGVGDKEFFQPTVLVVTGACFEAGRLTFNQRGWDVPVLRTSKNVTNCVIRLEALTIQ
jgi:hypothetical protein